MSIEDPQDPDFAKLPQANARLESTNIPLSPSTVESAPPADFSGIATESITGSETFQTLDPRVTKADLIGGILFCLVLVIGLGIGLLITWFNFGFEWPFYAAGTISILLLVASIFHAIFWPNIAYKRASYRVDQEGLEIHRGVLVRHQISVPLGRVQHADVSQGPIEQLFGISTLVVHTAGTSNASIELPGLEHQRAIAIRDLIVHQRKEQDVV